METPDIDKLIEDINPNEDMQELQVGHIVKGVVACNYKDFSFVRIGPVSCILPKSEISYDKKPQSLKVGKEIEAVVIKVSEEQGVMLSIKRAKNDPWEYLDEIYLVGQRINVSVKNITSYGAFVEFGDGLSGIVHRKELSTRKHFEPNDVVAVGDNREAEIISIDKKNRKVQLSFKKCMYDPWKQVEQNYPVGTKLKSKVINLLDYGAFFELEPGVKALLHRTEVGLTKKDKMKDYLSIGDELEVEICTVDVENKKISLHCDSFPKK